MSTFSCSPNPRVVVKPVRQHGSSLDEPVFDLQRGAGDGASEVSEPAPVDNFFLSVLL
jgi:hypothetical protein